MWRGYGVDQIPAGPPLGFFAYVASIMTPPVAKSCTAKMEIAVRKLIIPKNEVLAAALFIVLQVRIR